MQDLLRSYNDPGYALFDSPSWMANKEQELLGISLTCNKVDEYDTTRANCTCKEFIDGFESQHGAVIAVQIESVREWTIKKGKAKGNKMGFVVASDNSCCLDNITAFSEEWDKYKNLLAIAGIGNPEKFFQLLEQNDLKIEKKLIFPDHYEFNKNEVIDIIKEAKEANLKIITTEKDYCRIKKFELSEIDFLRNELQIHEDEKLIERVLEVYDKKN